MPSRKKPTQPFLFFGTTMANGLRGVLSALQEAKQELENNLAWMKAQPTRVPDYIERVRDLEDLRDDLNSRIYSTTCHIASYDQLAKTVPFNPGDLARRVSGMG